MMAHDIDDPVGDLPAADPSPEPPPELPELEAALSPEEPEPESAPAPEALAPAALSLDEPEPESAPAPEALAPGSRESEGPGPEAAPPREEPMAQAVPQPEPPPPAPFLAAPGSVPPRPTPVRDDPPQVTQRGGFLPLLLGGLVAGGIGYAAAWTSLQRDTSATTAALATQAERLNALEQAVPAPVDLAPLTGQLAALETAIAAESQRRAADLATLGDQLAADLAGLSTPMAAVQAQAAALDTRLSTLERAPAADGTLPDQAVAAWQGDIAALQTAVAALDRRLAETTDTLTARLAAVEQSSGAVAGESAARVQELQQRLDAAQAEATTVQADATATAVLATQRAAMTRLLAALDAGTPFDGALGELTAAGMAVPADLTGPAADGVPTTAALQGSFPAAARAALATARAEGLADAEGSRFVAFLRSQFDVRSVAPREGGDPDAILSRAEAALAEGRLRDTLAEIAALPEVVRAEMTDWTAAAMARAAAVAAAQTLSESLNMN